MVDIVTKDGLSIHYGLTNNNSHVMDANIESEGTQVFLRAANYCAKAFRTKLNIKTSSLGQGSVVRYFQFELCKGYEKDRALLSALTYMLKEGFFNKKSIGMESLINNSGEQHDELEKIFRSKHILEEDIKSLSSNYYITNQRNNFYTSILKSNDIESVDLTRGQNFAINSDDTVSIGRKDFLSLIEKVEPDEKVIDNAKIYIVSPVLMKSEKKWAGLYNNRPITFKVLSSEFKVKSENGECNFRSGTNIICTLRYKIRYDEDGTSHAYDYEVPFVSKVGEDDDYRMTLEGKQRQFDESQPNLFDNDPVFKK